MEALDAFREETRRWLVANAPPSMCKPLAAGEDCGWGGRKGRWPADVARWLAAMAERGWTAPTWPREYGGGGLSEEAGKVLAQEMAKLGARPPLVGFGLTMIGPLLLHVGSEEQKRQHLPPIVRGDIRWCQGYSEPGAGSDLAGLQTRAVRDGDVFVVNGQKIWTSHADHADWMFLLVRTDPEAPKHTGITFLLMDMDSPGPETSIFKYYGTELNQRRRDLAVRIAGPQALGWEGAGFDDEELKLARDWLRSRGNSIEGGTSEVQLNIIAKRVLGLPD